MQVLHGADYSFVPRFVDGRILAITDRNAPNRRIVEVQPRRSSDPVLFDVVPETDAMIRSWFATATHILVTYSRDAKTQIEVFDSSGKRLRQIHCKSNATLRVISGDPCGEEILIERESFTEPIEISRYSPSSDASALWAKRKPAFDACAYTHTQASFLAKDGTSIPIFLVGKREVLNQESQPVIMTAYGGYGVPMTPQFSVLVGFLIERGCLFALPCIRGGSEFGARWHDAAKRRNRQVAFDDFLSAAEWLIRSGTTTPEKLAIFGGSNSGLLVGAAMTQRPDLFRAVLCMVPMLDMLRYHLFDAAYLWKDEFGTVDDAEDFRILASYSPYHAVRDGTAYPAAMIVSGDADQNCNPLHARKMAARLQAATSSPRPILLDYSPRRGHSPVLPLNERVDALSRRLAFVCDQLELNDCV